MSVDDEAARYREAARLTLEQLQWCITYLHSIRKARIARVLEQNHSTITQRLSGLEGDPSS